MKTKEASGEHLPLVNPLRMRKGYGSRFVSVYVCVCYHASYYIPRFYVVNKVPLLHVPDHKIGMVGQLSNHLLI